MPVIEKVLWGAILIMSAFLGTLLLLKLINIFFFGPSSTPFAKQDPSVNTATLKILQYNASWRPTLTHKGKPEFASERANLLVSELKSYDVVCLNECFSYIGSPVSSFVKSMVSHGFRYFARGTTAGIFSPHVVDGGILVFSKYPILMHEYHTFDLGGGAEEWMAKGSLYVRVQMGAGTHVHIFAVNPQPDRPGAEDECRAVRFTHLREVRAQMERKASDGQPIILVGDLNIDGLATPVREGKATNEYQRLLTTFAKQSYTIVDTLIESMGEHLPTYGVGDARLTPKEVAGTGKRTEYILVFSRDDGVYTMTGQNSRVVKFEVDGNKNFTTLSPHYGLEADILFSRSEGATV
jgi:endonuclease/exonuclease/phosphatase family metal-dependent hydrolase